MVATQLVRELHRNRSAAGSFPARRPILGVELMCIYTSSLGLSAYSNVQFQSSEVQKTCSYIWKYLLVKY